MPIVLDRPELNLLWRHLDLGVRPLTLNTRECGTTLAENAEFDRQSAANLRGRGLLQGDTVLPELAAGLRCLARPRIAVDLRWTMEPGRELRVLAAGDGDSGTRGVLDDERLAIDEIHPGAVVGAIVEVLGEMPVGVGQAVSVPVHVIAQAGADGRRSDARFEDGLVELGVRSGEARGILAMLGGARLRAGQIGVTGWDRAGQRRRAPWVIDVYDTVQGRYAVHHRDDWVTVAPAGTARIAEMIRELLETLHEAG
ncbi:ESX secretion-associated protein EspG [Actinoalloteichus hymeniacidonis]|uniref:EspG family n=1 Tax=Actinoalloteichus hymeniacidonis TaxID=340345 RepID=A0AAC9N003_9PSEU|nr:ESX secretion-associated protein EspG [Actinoalloteichus hymeniacidonis]AOS65983.1 EspG family [Actinoalloteichus hymeniacidonis]MBB5905915.1 hypothetical protein [Actinoalloteichus hymeniacidonis]